MLCEGTPVSNSAIFPGAKLTARSSTTPSEYRNRRNSREDKVDRLPLALTADGNSRRSPSSASPFLDLTVTLCDGWNSKNSLMGMPALHDVWKPDPDPTWLIVQYCAPDSSQ